MSLLVILLPDPQRSGDAPAAQPSALNWWLSPDGLSLTRQGCDLPAQCPKADTVVALASPQAVAWHRVTVPKAPANRLRAALGGMLEEQLLGDDDNTHLALPTKPAPGAPTWVAALNKPWLQAHLATLATAGLVIERLVPALAPMLPVGADGTTSAAPAGYFFTPTESSTEAQGDDVATGLQLAISDADGALCLPTAGGLARSLLADWLARGAQFSASPAAAAAAERWVGRPVAMRTDAEQALAAVRGPWNLLQFELAPQHRSSLALGKLWQQLQSPAWAPVRWGVAALVLVQVLGLNVMAWQHNRALAERRAGMDALLRSTHPQVRAVLDAAAQMQSETTALRVAAGVPTEDDLEPLLAATAGAWPDGQVPAAQLRFEPGRLSLPATGWAPAQIEQLRQRLQSAGMALETVEGRLTIHRATPARQP
jgi:general secretion pathway protein L